MSKCEEGSATSDFLFQVDMQNHLNKPKEKRLTPNGYCHSELCEEKLRGKDQLFCNASCAEDYDKQK